MRYACSSPGPCYHVTARGNERKAIFRDDRDRGVFLERLAVVVRRYELMLHAYVLMRNHYHLLLTTPAANLAPAMRQLNGVYTQDFNRRHARVGHLLQGRYKHILVDKDSYLLELSRYIHLNPVRVGEVREPTSFRWSSAAAYVGKRSVPDFLRPLEVLGQFGRKLRPAQRRYAQFLRDGVDKGVPTPWKAVLGQSLLGERKWVEHMKRRIREKGAAEGILGRWEITPRPTVSVLVTQVARHARVKPAEIVGRHSRHWGRSVAMWLAWELSGRSQGEIGQTFGVGTFGVSKAIQRAEQMRRSNLQVGRAMKAILASFKT